MAVRSSRIDGGRWTAMNSAVSNGRVADGVRRGLAAERAGEARGPGRGCRGSRVGARRAWGAEGDGQTFPLGYIWDELEPAVQREALRWVFQEVRVSRVERGAEPSLEFVPRATRPWTTLHYRPPEIERV